MGKSTDDHDRYPIIIKPTTKNQESDRIKIRPTFLFFFYYLFAKENQTNGGNLFLNYKTKIRDEKVDVIVGKNADTKCNFRVMKIKKNHQQKLRQNCEK